MRAFYIAVATFLAGMTIFMIFGLVSRDTKVAVPAARLEQQSRQQLEADRRRHRLQLEAAQVGVRLEGAGSNRNTDQENLRLAIQEKARLRAQLRAAEDAKKEAEVQALRDRIEAVERLQQQIQSFISARSQLPTSPKTEEHWIMEVMAKSANFVSIVTALLSCYFAWLAYRFQGKSS